MTFRLFYFILYIFIPVNTQSLCSLPSDIVTSANNYCNHVKCLYQPICSNNQLNISSSFIILFGDELTYKIDPSINYFLISNSLKNTCKINLFNAKIKWNSFRKILEYYLYNNYRKVIMYSDSMADDVVSTLLEIIEYYGGEIGVLQDHFEETVISKYLYSCYSYENVLLLNFLTNEAESEKLLSYYQNNLTHYSIYVLSYFIDETYCRSKPQLVKNIHILSGYFENITGNENEVFKKNLGVGSGVYLNDYHYQLAIIIEFINLIPMNYPNDNPSIIRRQFLNKFVYVAGKRVIFSPNNAFDRNLFIGTVNDEGNVIDIFEFNTNYINYEVIEYANRICQFVEVPEIINYGFLSPLVDKYSWVFLHGILLAIDDINQNASALNSHIILRLPKSFNSTLEENYEYFKQYNMFLLFYLIYDDNITGLLKLIENDPNFPIVITHGYFTGKTCNPKLIYMGMSFESRFLFLQKLQPSSDIFLISPNTNYGNNIANIFVENIITRGITTKHIEIVNKTEDDLKRVVESFHKIATSKSVIYIIIDSCSSQNLILTTLANYVFPCKINLFGIDTECNNDYESTIWSGYYTAYQFVVPSDKSTSVYKENRLYSNQDGISPIFYSGYYGTVLFEKVLLSASSNDLDTLLTIIPTISETVELDNVMSFTNDNYISSGLQYAVTIGNGDYQLITQSFFSYKSYPYNLYLENNKTKLDVCSWSAKDYRNDMDVFMILIIDENYLFADFAQSILDSIKTPKTSNDLFFIVSYHPLPYNDESVENQIKYLVEFYNINCILLNDNYHKDKFLNINNIPILTIVSHDDEYCDSKLFSFGFSKNSVISTSIALPFEKGCKRFAYITNKNNNEKDITSDYLSYLIYMIYSRFKVSYTILNYNSRDKIKEFIENTTEFTFIYIGISISEDYELTNYLIKDLHYNTELIHLLHFHNLYGYFMKNLEIKNQFFLLNHLQLSTDEMNKNYLERFIGKVNIDLYSLYSALYYAVLTESKSYYQYTTDFIHQLSGSSYKIFDDVIQSSIIDNQLSSIINFVLIVNENQIIFKESSTKDITNSLTLSSYVYDNEVEICDLDFSSGYKKIPIIRIGLLADNNEVNEQSIKSFTIAFRSFSDSLEMKYKMFHIETVKLNIEADNFDVDGMLNRFTELNITHVFGVFYQHILNQLLPHLPKYNIVIWFIGSIPMEDFCNNQVISFYIPISLLSLIPKNANKAILIYTNDSYYNGYIDEIKNNIVVYNDITVIPFSQIETETRNEEFVSRIIEKIDDETEIFTFLKIEDFLTIVPYLVNKMKILKYIPKWTITSLIDYPILKYDDKIYNEIRFISAINFLNHYETLSNIRNIYKTYNVKSENPSSAEFLTYVALQTFVKLIQKVDYNSVTIIQEIIKKYYLENDLTIMSKEIVPSYVIRNNISSYLTILYLNQTFTNIYLTDNPFNKYSCFNGNYSNDKLIMLNYSIVIIEENDLNGINNNHFLLSILGLFNDALTNMNIKNDYFKFNILNYNNDNKEDFINENEKILKKSNLIIGIVNSEIRDFMDKRILRKYEKVMYYLNDDPGISCSPYIFYFGLPSQAKVQTVVPHLIEECESSIIVYPNSVFYETEINFFEYELNNLHHQVLNKFKVLNDQANLSIFIKVAMYNLPEDGCILNFLDDYGTINLINTMNNFAVAKNRIIISLNLNFDEYTFPPSIITHKIITYYNPITYSKEYQKYINDFYNTYGVELQFSKSFHNAILAVNIWEKVMNKARKFKYQSVKDFILAHNNVVVNDGNYNIRMQINHHTSYPRYILLQQSLSKKVNILFYSKDVYTSYIYSIHDPYTCFFDEKGFYENYTTKRVIKIGMLIPSNILNLNNLYPNLITSIASFLKLKNTIFSNPKITRNNFTITLDIQETKNDEESCVNAIQYYINTNADYVVTAESSLCLKSMLPYLNDSSPIVFATDELMGDFCNYRIVYTTKAPNQVINPTLGYFTVFLRQNPFGHVIYSHNRITDTELMQILNYVMSAMPYKIYLMDDKNVELKTIMSSIYQQPGIIYTFIDANDLGKFLKQFQYYTFDSERWKIVSFLVSDSSILHSIPKNILDNVYINTYNVNEDISNPLLDYIFLENNHESIYNAPVEIAFSNIYEMILYNKTLKELYGNVIHNEIVGDYQVDESNGLRYPIILSYFSNGVKEIVFPSSYLFKPNPPLYTLKFEQCDFSISNEMTPVKRQNIGFGIIYQNYIDLTVAPLLAQVLNYMAFSIYYLFIYIYLDIQPGIQYFGKFTYLVTEEDIRNFIIRYINNEEFPCFIMTHAQFDYKILDLISSTEKTFYINIFRNDYCLENLVTTETYSHSSLIKIIQQFVLLFNDLKFFLFHDTALSNMYDEIEDALHENGYTPYIRYSTDEIDKIISTLHDELDQIESTIIIFIDTNDDVISEIEEVVNMSNKVFYFQWYYESELFLKRSNHFIYGSAYPEGSKLTESTSLKYYTNQYNDNSIYNYYALNKYYDIIKLVYLWMELERSEKPRDLHSVYSRVIESEVGDVILNPNNRIGSNMVLYYRNYNNELVEYKLSNFVQIKMFYINIQDSNVITICNWIYYNGMKNKTVITIGVITPPQLLNEMHPIFSLVIVFLRVLKESEYDNDGLLAKYSIKPIIKYITNGNESLRIVLKELYKIDSIYAIFDFSSFSLYENEELINRNRVFYYDVTYLVSQYCSNNILNVGLSVLSLVRYTYLDLIETVKTVIIIHNNNDFGTSFIKFFEMQTEGSLTEIVKVYVEDNYDIIDHYIPKCIENSYSCAIILSVYVEKCEKLLYHISKYNVSYEKDILLYYYFYDTEFNDTVKSMLKGSVLVSTYLTTALYNDISNKHNNMLENFPKYICEEFSNTVLPTAVNENVITSYLIFKKLLLSSDTIDYNHTLTNAHIMYFDSPSGPVYFGSGNTLICDVIFSKLNSSNAIESTRKSVNPSYWYNPCVISIKPLYVGLLFDYSDVTYFASQIYNALVQELIVNYNIIGGINDRQIEPILYSLFQNDSDIETIEKLMNNSDISIIIGSNSHYTTNLILPYITNSQKLLFSHMNNVKALCNPNIIHIGSTLNQRSPFAVQYLESTLYETNILLYDNIVNEDPNVFDNDIISFKAKFYLNDSSNSSQIKEVIEYIKLESENSKVAIFNALCGRILIDFENIYVSTGFIVETTIQIIFNLDEYILGFDLLNKLAGNIVISSFIENSNNHLATLFESMIETRFGSIRLTQRMALFDVSMKLLISTYKQAEKLASEDHLFDSINSLVTDHNYPFLYLRRAAQLSSFESSCGNVKVSESNEVIYTYELGLISNLGYIVSVKSDTRKEISTNTFEGSCNFGPTIINYHISRQYYIPTLLVSGIYIIIMLIIVGLIIKLRKRLRSSNPVYLCSYILSQIFVVLLLIWFNHITTSSIQCECVSSLLYISVTNSISILVFKTWRIHTIYNNISIKSRKISDWNLGFRMILSYIPVFIICILFGIFNIIGYIQSIKSISMSTTIKHVYITRCEIEVHFFLIQAFTYFILIAFGLYYSWSTRNASRQYNDSKALATSIACMTFLVVIVAILEVSLDVELDVKYLLEILTITMVNFFITINMVGPKFYDVYCRSYYHIPSLSQSDGSELAKANLSPNLIDPAFAVDYSLATAAGTKKVKTETPNLRNNRRYQSATQLSSRMLYPSSISINKRLSALTPGLYTRRRGLEMIRGDEAISASEDA